MIYKLNSTYNTNFSIKKSDYYKLVDIENGWELVKNLSGPIPFCRYCSKNSIDYEWQGFIKNPLISDFVKQEH